MTSFVHVDCPTEHPGVTRAENAYAALKGAVSGYDSTRGGATLLLAAVVSALMVVANQVIDTWSEGHLLAAWMVLWVVAFGALAVLATPVRRVAVRMRAALAARAERIRRAQDDDRTWRVAMTDPRVMAELNRALGR